MPAEARTLEEILAHARRAIPGCVAVGCIDARLGLLLHASNDENQAPDPMEMVTAAMGELFRSSHAQSIDSVFGRLDGQARRPTPRLQQVFALSSSYIYVYQCQSADSGLILATICRAEANLGMVLARARATLAELQASGAVEATTHLASSAPES